MSDDAQSELGDPPVNDQQTIAEEFAENQQQASVAEFFGKNKQMLGFDSKPRALFTTIKEAVDNSLDAAEEAGILPSIYVNIEQTSDGYFQVTIRDNGPGITEEQIPKVFGRLLYGSRFHTRQQTRGQQGIGISAAVLNGQRTSGKPAQIVSREKGGSTAYYYELIIDEEENRPDIREKQEYDWNYDHGTEITLELDANLRARNQIHKYVRYTAVVNPHARIEFHEPDADLVYERSTDELPRETEEIDPHPHGVELGTLIRMLRNTDNDTLTDFLQNEFVRVGKKGAENILNNFRNQFYGRDARWPVRQLENTEEILQENGLTKGVEHVATGLEEYFNNKDTITHSELHVAVDSALNYAEEQMGQQLGTPLVSDEKSRWVQSDEPDRATLDNWSEDGSTHPLVQAVINSVTRKDRDAVQTLATSVKDRINHSRVTPSKLEEIVGQEADKVEDVTGERFGSTARQNVVDALWSAIEPDEVDGFREEYLETVWEIATNGRADYIHERLQEVTTAQKDDDAVHFLAERLGEEMRSFPERFTLDDLANHLDAAADTTENETGERFGDTSREKIRKRLWEEMETPDVTVPSIKEMEDDRDACQMLLAGMKEANVISPPTDCLSPITEEKLETGMKTVYEDAEFYTTITRKADVYSGDPFIVEAGIAYGPKIFDNNDDNKAELLRFANRVPLVYQQGACASTDVIKRITWRNYFKGGTRLSQSGNRGIPHGPLVILVHVASTNVPFTSESKDAIANVEIIEDEIERAVRGCGRELKSHLSEKQDRRERRKKRNEMTEIIPDMATKLSNITDEEDPEIAEPIADILNNTFVGWEDNDLVVENNQRGTAEVELAVAYNDSFDEDDVDADGDVLVGDRRQSEINDAVDNRRVTGSPSTFIIWNVEVKGGGNTARLSVPAAPNKKYVVNVDEIADEKVTIQDWM